MHEYTPFSPRSFATSPRSCLSVFADPIMANDYNSSLLPIMGRLPQFPITKIYVFSAIDIYPCNLNVGIDI